MIRRVLTCSLLLTLAVSGFRSASEGRIEGIVRHTRGPAVGAVVFLTGARADVPEPAPQPVIVDQIDLRFVPEVVAVLAGTVVAFPNSDPILHNVFSPRGPGAGFDLGTYPPGETRSHRFDEAGVHVILCHVHPEMVAYVAVVPSRYHAVADSLGRFELDALPAGRYALSVWYARRTALEREITVPAGGTVRLELELGR
jgi:plastocyanin